MLTKNAIIANQNISLHDMTWEEIAEVSDKTVFEDCMLCGDTKSVQLDLNTTIARGNSYTQYGDGAGKLVDSIKPTYKSWNLENNNAKTLGGYSSSRIRATLIGTNAKTNATYAGSDTLSENTCLYSCMSNDLKNVITAKKVKYVTGTSASNYSSNDDIVDKIWLLSAREMYGTGTNSGNTAEGLGTNGDGYDLFGNSESKYHLLSYGDCDYEYFADYEMRTTCSDNDDWGCEFFLRSIDFSQNDFIKTVDQYGNIDIGFVREIVTSSDDEYEGINFGFCID